jgi:phosphoadenosine phosphosulfate reductase
MQLRPGGDARGPDADTAAINTYFRGRHPIELLDRVAEQFAGQTVLTCSFGGAGGMALLDMVARRGLPIDVLFLDTDLLFPETYALVAAVEDRYGITIRRRRPTISLELQAQQHGPDLYARNPDRCCGLRKVAPLAEALRPYQAWVSAIRRDQTAQRATVEPVAWHERHGVFKFSPLAAWTERDVWAYLNTHDVPYNPLLDQGYPSLGCIPCTSPASVDNPRGGRWPGFAKTECGIHASTERS